MSLVPVSRSCVTLSFCLGLLVLARVCRCLVRLLICLESWLICYRHAIRYS